MRRRNTSTTATVTMPIAATVRTANQNVELVSALIAGPGENRGPNSGSTFRRAQPMQRRLSAAEPQHHVQSCQSATVPIAVPVTLVPTIAVR